MAIREKEKKPVRSDLWGVLITCATWPRPRVPRGTTVGLGAVLDGGTSATASPTAPRTQELDE